MLDCATEEVLFMECEDKQQKFVAYFSKSFNKTERNYKIHDKKILADIKSLEKILVREYKI